MQFESVIKIKLYYIFSHEKINFKYRYSNTITDHSTYFNTICVINML